MNNDESGDIYKPIIYFRAHSIVLFSIYNVLPIFSQGSDLKQKKKKKIAKVVNKQIHCQTMAVYLLHKTRSLVECSLLCQQKVECYTYSYINHGDCVMYKNEYIDTSTQVADDTVIYYFRAMIWWHTNRSVPECRIFGGCRFFSL